MTPVIGNCIALSLVALLVYVCVRNLLRRHKAGGCSGNCASCGSCRGDRGDRGQTPVSTAVLAEDGGRFPAALTELHVSEQKICDMQAYFEVQKEKEETEV